MCHLLSNSAVNPCWFIFSLFIFISATGEWQMKLSVMTLTAIPRYAFPPGELEPFLKATLLVCLLFSDSDHKHIQFKSSHSNSYWHNREMAASSTGGRNKEPWLENHILSWQSWCAATPCSSMAIRSTSCKYLLVLLSAGRYVLLSPPWQCHLLSDGPYKDSYPHSQTSLMPCVQRTAAMGDPGMTEAQCSSVREVGGRMPGGPAVFLQLWIDLPTLDMLSREELSPHTLVSSSVCHV